MPHQPQDPVEQDWRHDGFEELKKADENLVHRSSEHSDRPSRGGSWARGRIRGNSQVARSESSHSQADRRFPPSRGALPWYRSEHAWTKHAVGFLFNDQLTRPRDGDAGGVRIKLPGQRRYSVVRLAASQTTKRQNAQLLSTPVRSFVVKLPKSRTVPVVHVVEKVVILEPEDVHTVAAPPIHDDIVIVAPKVVVPPKAVVPPTPSTPPIEKGQILNTPAKANAPPTQPVAEPAEPPHAFYETTVSAPPEGNYPTDVYNGQVFPPPNVPSPSYPSPSYGPGYQQYPVQRPTATYPQGGEQVWYDPRMPYGYPTPPPPPQPMYTPPPPSHHVHHSHSMSHIMPPPPPGVAPPYYHQVPQRNDYPQQTSRDSISSTFSYAPNGVMFDTRTGTPIFSLARSGVKIAIRKPGERDEETNPNSSMESSEGGSSTQTVVTNTGEEMELLKGSEGVHVQPQQEMPMHGYPSGQVWNGYQGGYYYPQGYPVPHPQEYGYGQPMPPHGYVHGAEYQPPIYY